MVDIIWPSEVCEDKLIWKGNDEGNLSVRSSYMVNFTNEERRENDNSWAKLWRLELHDRLKMFLWRMKAEVLPLKETVTERMGHGDKNCAICGEEAESYIHLFKRCEGIRVLGFASKWGCCLDNWMATTSGEMILHCIEPKRGNCFQGMDERMTTVFLSTLMYVYWNYKNSFVYDQPKTMESMVRSFNHLVEEMAGTTTDSYILESERSAEDGWNRSTGWSFPLEGWLKINTDAALRHGAVGMVVRDDSGGMRFFTAKLLNSSTVKGAELAAILWASEVAEEKS